MAPLVKAPSILGVWRWRIPAWRSQVGPPHKAGPTLRMPGSGTVTAQVLLRLLPGLLLLLWRLLLSLRLLLLWRLLLSLRLLLLLPAVLRQPSSTPTSFCCRRHN